MDEEALTSRGTYDFIQSDMIIFIQGRKTTSRCLAPRCLLSQVLLEKLCSSPSQSLTCRLPGSLQQKGEVVLAELLSSKHQEFEKKPFPVLFFLRPNSVAGPLSEALQPGGNSTGLSSRYTTQKTFFFYKVGEFLVTLHKKGNSLSSLAFLRNNDTIKCSKRL